MAINPIDSNNELYKERSKTSRNGSKTDDFGPLLRKHLEKY